MVSKSSSIKNFWMIFFGVIALIAIASAVTIGVVASDKIAFMRMSVIDDDNNYKISQENNYKRSLYLACDSMKNLDANLGKISVSNDKSHQTEMLTKVIVNANAVNQCLSNLPFADSDNLSSCQTFANQTQDYATYLLGKLSSGENLSASEKTALANLDEVAANLYEFLQDYAESDSGMFLTNGNGANNVGSLSESLDGVDSKAFEYEKLIYDGPFSESVQGKEYKITNKISHEQGSEKIKELFGENKFAGEMNGKGLRYVYELENGRVITLADGRVMQYEQYKETSAENAISCDKCIETAQEFCNKLGYDVQGVWVSKTQDTVTYVNCATVTDGVIVYPELIKVAVSAQGEVVGMEAGAYLLNKQTRNVNFGEVSQEDAQKALNGDLAVTNVAKALIEKNGKTYLAYEFQCQKGDRQYYVYVDSNTGKEVNIFKVIQNTEGYTVL